MREYGKSRRNAKGSAKRSGQQASVSPECTEKELILLGLLAEAPCHAYVLEQKIKSRRMSEWTEISTSSVYRVLQGLEEHDLIATTLVHRGQGATRKVHHLTPAGKRTLAFGVLDRLGLMRPVRSPVQVGLAFAINAPHVDVIAQLEQRTAATHAVQAQVATLRASFREGVPVPTAYGEATLEHHHAICVQLLFDHLEHHLQAEQTFLRKALHDVALESPSHFAAPEVLAAPEPAAVQTPSEVAS